MNISLRTPLALALVASVLLATQGHCERLLVPVAYTGPGAHGSLWFTFVTAVNRGSESWASPGIGFTGVFTDCAIPEGCSSDHLNARETGTLLQSGTYQLQVPDHSCPN